MPRLTQTGSGLKLGLMPTVFAVVAALYFAQEVLIPLAVAILLAFLLAPLVDWMERRKLGRIAPVLLSVGIALGFVGTIGWVVERQFVDVAERLPDYRQNIQQKLHRFKGAAGGSFSKAAKGVEETIKSMASTQPTSAPVVAAELVPTTQPAENWAAAMRISLQNPLPVREYPEPPNPLEFASKYFGRLLGPLATAGMIVVFLIFMLLNRRDLRDRMIRLVGHGQLTLTTQALDDAATRISRYLLMQFTLNTGYGICIGTGLWIIGRMSAEGQFPNVMLWALLAAVLRFVPYLGPFIGAAVPVLLSLAMFNSAGVFAATLCLYAGIELVVSNAVEPWLYGSSTGLSVMAVLVSAVFWTWLWGPVGLLVSTPLTVCVVVIGKYVPQLRFLDVILGDDEVLTPAVRVYQRLLSLDQEEAADLLHGYRKENGLEAVYDQVMVPALAMAERDRHTGKLDDEQEVFIRQSMREFVEELGDAQTKTDGVTPPASDESSVTVLCLPAHDEADEIVGMMLARLLVDKGQRAVAASQVSLAGEMLELVDKHHAGMVCISALPPGALTHSRYLCKRLRGRFTDLPLLVGLWTSKVDPKKLMERMPSESGVSLTTSLAAALTEIHQMIQPVLVQRGGGEAKESGMVASGNGK